MGALASPLQFAAAGGALILPLAAGVAVVVWSKARAARHARRVAATERELASLYRSVELQPVPQRLAMVIDAVEEGEELASSTAKGKAGVDAPSDT
jgi:hypothetical protein